MPSPDCITDASKLFSPCFWVRKWRDALAGAPYTATDPEFWDTASAGYDEGFDERARKSLDNTVDIFRRNGILKSGLRVLDIGCGTGEFALALAREGSVVTAVDFSEGMLNRLREKLTPELKGVVNPVRADWQNIDLADRNWRGRFDLVTANMTPALRDPDALFRMRDASREWCFLKGWAQRRRNTVLEKLWPRVMEAPRDERPPEFPFQFNVLYAQGFFPAVSFEEMRWKKTVPLAEAIGYYDRYFFGISPHTEARLHTLISKYLKEMANNGLIHEDNRGWTGSLLWREE